MQSAYKPTGTLASYVEHLWYCDGRELSPRITRILPSGKFQLLFSLTDAPIGGGGIVNRDVGRGASSLVVGIETQAIVIDTGQLQSAMGVLFRPGGARAFFDPNADVFCNQRSPLELIWGSFAGQLRNRLREARNATDKFRVLETALLSRVSTRVELHIAVRYALGEFSRAPHGRSVLGVIKETGLSRRRLAQLFREQVGITPKLYCRLHRFQHTVRQMAVDAPVDWADLALAAGYFDQAHMAHEFKSFSGISPSAYRVRQRHPEAHPPAI